jgi:hypothetical protein
VSEGVREWGVTGEWGRVYGSMCVRVCVSEWVSV